MGLNKNRIVFAPNLSSQFPLMVESALRLRKYGLSVAFYCNRDLEIYLDLKKIAEDNKIELLESTLFKFDLLKFAILILKNFRIILYIIFTKQFKQLLTYSTTFFTQRELAFSALKQHRVTHLICHEDGISGPSDAISASKLLRLPIIIIPYEISDSKDFYDLIKGKFERGELIFSRNKTILILLFNSLTKWIKKFKGVNIQIFPDGYIAAREIVFGQLPNPWTVHGGTANIIAVESNQMLQIYRNEGIPNEKLIMTGSPYCDAMFDALGRNQNAKLAYLQCKKCNSDKTRLLVSMPPSYHGTRLKEAELPTYEDFWIRLEQFQRENKSIEIFISFHPSTSPQYKKYVEKLNLSIEKDWILSSLPSYDLYLTCFSSTIRWALALGKPIINYDMYKFRLTPYEKAIGFFNYELLDDAFKKIMYLNNNESYEHTSKMMFEQRNFWGSLDGKTTDHLVTVLDLMRSI